MKKFVWVSLLSFTCLISNAQTGKPTHEPVNLDSVLTSCNIEKQTFLYTDSLRNQKIEEIFSVPFIPLEAFRYSKSIPQKLLTNTFYLQFTLQNNADSEKTIFLYPGMLYDKLQLFVLDDAGKPLEITDNNSKSGFLQMSLPRNSKYTYLVKAIFSKRDFNSIQSELIHPVYLEKFKLELTNAYHDNKISSYVFSGVLIMMILLALVNYIMNKKIEFIYFIFFALCMLALIFFSSYLSRKPGELSAFFRSYFDFTLLIIGNIFYLKFLREFLSTRFKHPNLDTLLKVTTWLLMSMFLIFSLVHYGTDNIQLARLLENSMKIAAMILGLVFIYLALRKKDTLLNYIAIGSAVQIFFSAISLILILNKNGVSDLYKSALFYFELSIIMAVFFFLLGLTYKNRRNLIDQIRKQESLKIEVNRQEFEKQLAVINAHQDERKRISEDMHDDLGAGITSIRLYSEIVKSKLSGQVLPELEKISTSANELLNNINAIIWSMSSKNDSLGNTIAYIRSYTFEFLEDTGIVCNFFIPDRLPAMDIPGEYRRNLFLLVKEALNNIVKHSGASHVEIALKKELEGLSLYIRDNGEGISLDKIGRSGNGLKNMKKRMESLEISFSIENNNGTLIRLYKRTRF